MSTMVLSPSHQPHRSSSHRSHLSSSHRLLEYMCRRHGFMWRRSHTSMLHRTITTVMLVTVVAGIILAGAVADGVTVDGGMVDGGMVDGGALTGNEGLFGGLPNYLRGVAPGPEIASFHLVPVA
jgi:hypothetical protein